MTVLAAKKPIANQKSDEKIYSLEEYLLMEETTAFKSEFFNGKIIPMPGGTFKHNEIANNTSTALKNTIKANHLRYRVTNSDQKIYIPTKDIAIYPDALVVFEKPEFWNNRKDLIVNPLLIVEVLSKSTKGYDSGEKFTNYRTLPSFKEYVLIEQDSREIEVRTRINEKTWEITFYTENDNSISLSSLGVRLLIEDIYENTDGFD